MTPPRVSNHRGSTRSDTGTLVRRRRDETVEIPLRPVVWNILGTRWMLLEERDGLVTLQPINAKGTLEGSKVRLNTSEWVGAQRNGYQER